MRTEPNHQAYPLFGVAEGLSKREFFAALAMQGMIASDAVFNAINPKGDKDPGDVRREFGVHCCDMADALIAALNEERT